MKVVKNKIILWSVFLIVTAFIFPLTAGAQQKTLNLSSNARDAISNLAKNILTQGVNPKITDIKSQLDPQDYATVKSIKILPDNPLYVFKNFWKNAQILFTFNQVAKTYKILQNGNEKMLESLLVLEKAQKESDPQKRERLVGISATTLNNVGSDFDTVASAINRLKKDKLPEVGVIEDEAFRFAGYYLKHQVLLEKQEDTLSEQEFLTIEQARLAHLSSVAQIIVAGNSDPLLFGQELAQIVSPQVGSNNSQLATIAILRDLENNATLAQQKQLRVAQSTLRDELEVKLAGLTREERLKQIPQYLSFVHGNPIRQFQAYNALSKKFQSAEMNILTSALKDKSAQSFKKYLDVLNTGDEQNQFVEALFSQYPIDMKLLFYTEIQLTKDKAGTDQEKGKKAAAQLGNLEKIKGLLATQVCDAYGKDPKKLASTRFYEEAQANPTVLDVRTGQFLSRSLQNCQGATAQVLTAVATLQTNINGAFAKEASGEFFAKLPTKAQAQNLLKEEGITASPSTEQQVAEKIEEETKVIEEKISENPRVLEEQILDIVEIIATPPTKTVNDETKIIEEDAQTIIEELIDSTEPTEEEIIAKEEQIVEEIVDAAETGETSPLVSELPQEIQEEIAQETNVPIVTAAPTTTILDTVAPVVTTAPTVAPQVEAPTAVPAVAAPGL